MRAGACAPQQTLSAEAASVLKHSLTLARRRGHAQVTPLHVAATLLTSRASLLRRACLKSQPHHHPSGHPLQCRALELCFNVALNRLPAAPGPLLHAQPSLSNALVAALKRAQAHQRRGCIEQHQQQQQQQHPVIAVKVELDQLVLSILDDPSVSRVMREAGFSSTSVKNNMEECNLASSVFHCGGIYSTPTSPDSNRYAVSYNNPNPNPNLNPIIPSWQYSHLLSYGKPQPLHHPTTTNEDDVKVVLQVLLGNNKRRNAVIISDSSSTSETIISNLIQKLEHGINVPDELKSTQLVKFQFSSVPLMFMTKEEVETNVMDLKRKVDSLSSKGGVIIYIGDLKWAVDELSAGGGGGGSYNPIDHLIVEIGKLVSFYNSMRSSCMRVWLIATANYQTYIKCQMKQPPLDVQWALQAVSVPSGGLGLSLNATSGRDNSRITHSENSSPVSEKKLFYLEDDENALTCCQECISNYDKEAASPQLPYWLNSHSHAPLQKEDLDQLRRKYNKLCQSLHQGSQNPQNSSWNHYSYPFKKNMFSDSETISFLHPSPKLNRSPSSLPRFRRQQSCHIEFSFSNNGTEEPNLDSLKNKEEKITLALGNSTYTKSADLYSVFKENVPWQCANFPLIIDALKEEDKVILMQGNDRVGKRRLAVSIAECMLGSSEFLVCMNMRTGGKTGGENREVLETAMKNHERVVVLLEDVDFGDPLFLTFVFDGVKGRRDDVFLFTMGGDVRREEEVDKAVIPIRVLVGPCNVVDHKRKAEWDLIERGFKGKRGNNEIEEVSSNSIMNQIRELKRNLSTNGLDLNIKVDEDQESSPISSDLTIEENNTSLGLVSKIKNRVVLNLDSDQEREAKGMLLMKLRRAFREFSAGKSLSNFNVDETVLEEILKGAGWYLNGLFEEWLKDIFQTSLINGVNNGEGETVSFRVCLGGKEEYGAIDGFKGTCLPKRIPISFIG